MIVKEKYLILSDLDGTLLNNKGKLDQLTIDVVGMLIKKGHVFCILTGRPPETSLQIYQKLGLKHLLSNRNGSYIWHPDNSEFKALSFSFSFDVVENILKQKAIKKWTKNIVILNNKGAFISHFPSTSKEKKWYYQNLHIQDDGHLFEIKDDFSNVKNIDVQTVILLLDDLSKIDDIVYFIHLYSQTLIARFWRENSNGVVIEINSRFACKGKSIEFISNYYGVTLDHCVSFGDGDNDVEMLTTTRHSFAMKNATKTAKIYARYITKYDNDNCGVARELIKFFKLKGYNKKNKKTKHD